MVVLDFFFVEKLHLLYFFSTIEWHKVTRTRKTLCHLTK